MKKLIPVLALAALAVAGSATVAQSKVSSAKASAEVCVLLPDTKSSVRWEQADRPDIGAALKKAGVSYVINNAQGDAQKQRDQADQCLANGAKVIIITQLDAGSAIAIEKAAAAKGAKSIDYDRQVIGGKARSTSRSTAMLSACSRARASSPVSRRAACTARSRSSPSSTAARRTATRSSSRAGMTRSSSRSTRTAPSRRARISSAGLGQPEGPHDLRADARQDRQQDRRGRGGQ